MPSCVFRKCKNYTATVKEKNISFHGLPRKDVVLKGRWIKIIRAQRRENDWMPTAYTTICSEHFAAHDIYVTKENFRRLRKSAVPIIKKDAEKRMLKSSQANPESLQESRNTESPLPKHEIEEILDNASPTSLDLDKGSYEDSADTPELVFLKNEIKKLTEGKRKLRLENYGLTRKNKRLQEKCNSLKQVVSKLKKIISKNE